MFTISDEELERLREEYPVGTAVILRKMEDFQAPPVGTVGLVRGCDDTGSLMMSWETGGSLSLLYGVDKYTKVEGPLFTSLEEAVVWVRKHPQNGR